VLQVGEKADAMGRPERDRILCANLTRGCFSKIYCERKHEGWNLVKCQALIMKLLRRMQTVAPNPGMKLPMLKVSRRSIYLTFIPGKKWYIIAYLFSKITLVLQERTWPVILPSIATKPSTVRTQSCRIYCHTNHIWSGESSSDTQNPMLTSAVRTGT